MDKEFKRDIEILKKLNDIKEKYVVSDHIELVFKLDSLFSAQNKIINSLRKELAEYKEAVNKLCEMGDFYGNKSNWMNYEGIQYRVIIKSDCEKGAYGKGGNLARQTMQDELIKRLRSSNEHNNTKKDN